MLSLLFVVAFGGGTVSTNFDREVNEFKVCAFDMDMMYNDIIMTTRRYCIFKVDEMKSI